MDLRAWLLGTQTDLRTRLMSSVVGRVPPERWHDQAGDSGSSLTWLLLHLARHHDLALSTAIRDKTPRFFEHRTALGLAGATPSTGLEEHEDREASAAIGHEALVAYLDDTFAATERWLQRLSAMALDSVPDTARRLERRALLDPQELDWLFSMWSAKPVHWLVQWPMFGHTQSHFGEAVAVRNRLGFSPF